MLQRVSQEEYEEWKSGYITQQLFNFFKLEAELNRRSLLELDATKDFVKLGEEYTRRKFAAQCYDMLGTIEYLDLFPEESNDDKDSA